MSVRREIEFDYAAFEDLLFERAREAFTVLQQAHASEHFYVFGIHAGGKFLRIYIFANTEEKLLEYAKDAQSFYAKQIDLSLREVMTYLRYKDSWDYGIETRERFSAHFAPIHDLLRERDKQIVQMRYHNRHHVSVEENQEITAAQVERMNDLFVNVMKRLDDECVFEMTNPRSEVLVVHHYTPSNLAESESLQSLNPPEVVKKAEAELPLFRDVHSCVWKLRTWVPKHRRTWEKDT